MATAVRHSCRNPRLQQHSVFLTNMVKFVFLFLAPHLSFKELSSFSVCAVVVEINGERAVAHTW